MTPQSYITRLRELVARATPGPLIVVRFDNDGGDISYQIETESVSEDEQIFAWCGELSNLKRAKQNAALIAVAPDAITRLCLALEIAERAIEQSIARADDYGDSHCSKPIREAREAITRALGEEVVIGD